MAIAALEPLDARIPQWDFDQLTARLCPFCGTDNRSVLMRPDKLTVAFCKTCGCWYIDNLPSIADIVKLYDGYYHTLRPTNLTEKGASQMLENARMASESNWQLRNLLKLHSGNDRMRILDVGCGSGNFLLEAKSAGADVLGCDLSPEVCEFVNNRLGIKVHQSELHLCSSLVGNVDAVVMKDFMEHPVEPLIDVQAAVSILKPGGLLLLYTPNGGEAGIDVETAKKWVGFRVDLEHLQYISPQTINWIAEKYHLRIERLETSGFPGLKGIDKLPKNNSRNFIFTRVLLKKIPGTKKIVKILRVLKAELSGENRDRRLGSYHLFAILRKT
jgi:2-polyprenyl-3-methyl-5-hydroxy-6-metoxy-1,4-benzoquinol methylase